ncbi:MAG TPA: HNH endonuclease [Rugosimonospora sp.]|nr:HNH endonuclease [Rugosimonospora sp.]
MTDPRRQGRGGRPWARKKQQVLTAYGNTCWLCGQPIDLALHHTHRMSYTVDHIDPLSLGGDPLNLDLLRPAHRSCNSSRGNRPPPPRLVTSRNWYAA